ncbi:MAG TPA: ATP-binding protein [Trueperaceae bacterium]
MALNNRFPMNILWGPQGVQLYNDAYLPLIGDKHPSAMGRPVRESFPEVWHVVGSMLEGVLTTGRPVWSENQLLLLERHGFPEETYITFCYSPLPDDAGKIGGILATATETTGHVIGERRLHTLRDLGASAPRARNAQEACRLAAEALNRNPHDVPFALLYLLDDDGQRARLAGAVNLQADTAASPATIDLAGAGDQAWPLAQARESGPLVVDNLQARFGELPGAPWEESPRTALVVPIASAFQERQTGFLVAAISPRRTLDTEYRGFLMLIADQVSTAVANARAREEERKRAESLAELNRAKTEFFSNVSHEFRTPLTLLLGPLEHLLAERKAPLLPEQRAELEVAYRNGLRLLKLVNSLLDFSRIEAGRAEAFYEATDLGAYTAELASAFQSAVEGAGLRFIVHCSPLGQAVYVDREMWEKIVFNLLANALKFTFEGEIEVSLRQVDDHVEFSVRDTGIGIPAEELPHIFERFRRVEGARRRTHEGSGIGLALVRDLSEMHGGATRVTSTPGMGSTFTVSIPMGTAHLPNEKIGRGRQLPSTRLGARPYTEEARGWAPDALESVSAKPSVVAGSYILLADDNADMRDYVRRLLSEHHEVIAVADGRAALAAAEERRPDLVISDIMMPGLNGFELLRKLRDDPRTATIPVILLSARAGEESRVDGLESGADDYLVKPFSAQELVARVNTHLQLIRARREVETRKREIDRSLATQAMNVRHRIGLELHDGVRQQLAGIRWLAQNLQRELEADHMPQAAMLSEFSKLVGEANLEVRRLIKGLAPPQVGAADLKVALEELCHDAEAWFGTSCEFQLGATVGVRDDELADHLYHIAHEAVINAAKHGDASRIDLSLRFEDGGLTLQVRDNGKGLPDDYGNASGIGITSMHQRAELIGANLTITGGDSGGTTVTCSLTR